MCKLKAKIFEQAEDDWVGEKDSFSGRPEMGVSDFQKTFFNQFLRGLEEIQMKVGGPRDRYPFHFSQSEKYEFFQCLLTGEFSPFGFGRRPAIQP